MAINQADTEALNYPLDGLPANLFSPTLDGQYLDFPFDGLPANFTGQAATDFPVLIVKGVIE